MALQVLLLVLSAISLACGQQSDLTGPVREYPVLTGPEERALELSQNPELRDLAATRNERVFIRIDGLQSTAIVEEGVNANIDCFPWLSRFPGGSVQWLMQPRDENGQVTGPAETVMPTAEDQIDVSRTVVGGQFIRWFNITGTLIVSGAEDPSFGDYICMVCIARGTPFQQCHNGTVTLHILGAPPILEKAVDNEPELGTRGTRIYNIGADFCLDFSEDQNVIIRCAILEGQDVPQVIPSPIRTWVLDDEVIYSGIGDVGFNESFLMSGNNALFMPMAVNPAPLDISSLSSSGSIVINTEAGNLSMPMFAPPGTTQENVRRLVFQQLMGEYMCSVSNVFGSDSAETTVRECGFEPELPGCDAETLFLGENEIVPVGCNVCIPKGSSVTLNCTATNGTEPLMYMWIGPNGFESPTAVINVAAEGEYKCTVTNMDNPDGVMLTTNVFNSPENRLMAIVTDRFQEEVTGNGCGRLRGTLNPQPNMCVFLGEVFDLSCSGDNNMPLDVTYQNGSIFNGPIVVTEDLDNMTLQCNTVTNTPCDNLVNEYTLRVFDPARVNRNETVGPGEIGAGQTVAIQMVEDGNTITLVCPTSGIDDPQTNWNRIVTNAAGVAEEVPVNETDEAFSVMAQGFTLVLTITGYNGDRDDGVYVCRTENIAGEDAAIVSLSSTPDTGEWIASSFTKCNVECNEGVRVRSVTCRSMRDGRLLPNNQCAEPRPPSEMSCANLFRDDCLLTPIFVTGKYSPCSRGCEGGFRRRDVSCVVPMTGQRLRDSDCFPLRKPRETETCRNTCCIDDVYSTCKRIGSRLCNLNLYQQVCCWTCLLRVIP